MAKNGFSLDSILLDFDEEILNEKEILLLLSDMEPKNLEDISNLDIYEKDIKRCLDNLFAKNLILIDDSNKYSISKDINAFIEIFEMFNDDESLKKFIEYKYYKELVEKNFLLIYRSCIILLLLQIVIRSNKG
ncbi:hypothetical protein [Methanobacterium ferruginis]|uniref:hypothetical protein n=1 Tax=Methanobacterium ferruginis TaxID=710191 RepID=UPI002573AD52|nr:hypothetical protein [Methanobacterium ferruginis]BDZ67949.1 hypothetical protein GCM10025860_13970 [Methanobacterium ferruginis]